MFEIKFAFFQINIGFTLSFMSGAGNRALCISFVVNVNNHPVERINTQYRIGLKNTLITDNFKISE